MSIATASGILGLAKPEIGSAATSGEGQFYLQHSLINENSIKLLNFTTRITKILRCFWSLRISIILHFHGLFLLLEPSIETYETAEVVFQCKSNLQIVDFLDSVYCCSFRLYILTDPPLINAINLPALKPVCTRALLSHLKHGIAICYRFPALAFVFCFFASMRLSHVSRLSKYNYRYVTFLDCVIWFSSDLDAA